MHILSSFPSICFHLVLPAILIATPTLTAKGRSSHGEIADIHVLTEPRGGPPEGQRRQPLGSTGSDPRASPSGDVVPDGTTLAGIGSPTTRERSSSFGNDSSVVVSATEGGEGKSGIPEMGMGPPIPIGVPHGSLEGDTKGVREGDDRQHRKKAEGGGKGASTGRVFPHHRPAAGPGRTSSEDSDRQEPTESLSPAAAGQVGVDSGRLHTSQEREAMRSVGAMSSDSTQTGDVGKHLHLTADGGEPPGVNKSKTKSTGLVGQGVVSGLVQPAVVSNDSQSTGDSVMAGNTDNRGDIGVDEPSREAHVDTAVGMTRLPLPQRRLRPTTAYEGPSEATPGGGESPKEDSVTTPSVVDGPSVKSNDTTTTLSEPLHHSQDENMHGGDLKAEEAVAGPVEGEVGPNHLPSGEVAMRSFIAVTVVTLLLVAAVIGSFVCTKDSLQVRRWSRYDAARHGVRKVNIPSPGRRYNLVQPLSAITTTVQQGAAASSSSSSSSSYAERRF
ncbi:hypothetical protein FOZ61_001509 [Perkinsus olseni]|uniref:Transmembrane protein n=1 Tax=Perkinsus olseni TaxID=32597 RepID=A0A7J6LWH3_PEROL|nr:hypothetical protein FOZ61_001509 [Perkinsus olseni]